MEPQALALTDAYGYKILRAVILGIAGISPRSVMPNLTELLTNIVSKKREQSKSWLYDILFEVYLNFIIVPFF
jgi:Importin 13 repeat